MIHDELGRAWVVGDDGPEGVETRSPLHFLLAEEDGPDREDAMGVALEAVRALHTWVCEQGAHPRQIAERLLKASQHYAPAALAHLDSTHVAAVLGAADLREVALMRLLLDQPRAKGRAVTEHAARINGVLGKAFRREGHTWRAGQAATRLEVLTVEEELVAPAEADMRREAMRRWLRRMWMGVGREEAGAQPSLVEALKAFYALTRSFWPELILNMSGEEVSSFFVQTRAAESERVHRLINRPVERHCGRHTTLRFQKSTAACGKYAKAAKGNHHRSESAKRAA